MKIAPLPDNESLRIETLRKVGILDTEAEKDFDDVVRLASYICQTPISVISLIDEHRQWFKARLGVDVPETSRDLAFCAHALGSDEMMVVPDATHDERFFDNPFVTGQPDIRFYAGMPLTMHNGARLGTLCVIDRHPRELNDEQKKCLSILGKQVINMLELRLKIKELNQALEVVGQQKAALQKLNDAGTKLLSVIGHDLRSPMVSLVTVIELCGMKEMSPEEFQTAIDQIKINTFSAMDLLNDLLEWAEDQFTGRELEMEDIPVARLVTDVQGEKHASFTRKNNRSHNQVPAELIVHADRRAVLFMVRTLLLNANKYTEGGDITVTAETLGDQVRVAVQDTGIGMTQVQLDKLFNPTSRGTTLGTQGEKGSGIGLQLCKEFAQRHGGTVGAKSEPGKGSTFHFTLGRNPAVNSQSAKKIA